MSSPRRGAPYEHLRGCGSLPLPGGSPGNILTRFPPPQRVPAAFPPPLPLSASAGLQLQSSAVTDRGNGMRGQDFGIHQCLGEKLARSRCISCQSCQQPSPPLFISCSPLPARPQPSRPALENPHNSRSFHRGFLQRRRRLYTKTFQWELVY